MSDVEPLIRRELQWMALSSLEDKDLAAIIIAKSRRRKLRRWASNIVFAIVVSAISIQGYVLIGNLTKSETTVTASDTYQNSSVEAAEDPAQPSQETSPTGAQIRGVISDYPITWEESVGDLGAISKAAGIGDTLGGLTAQGL